jgi:hypothetical protein
MTLLTMKELHEVVQIHLENKKKELTADHRQLEQQKKLQREIVDFLDWFDHLKDNELNLTLSIPVELSEPTRLLLIEEGYKIYYCTTRHKHVIDVKVTLQS